MMSFLLDSIYRLLDPKAVFITAGFLWVSLVLPAFACSQALPFTEIKVRGHALSVEIAANPTARTCGLSQRAKLPENNGMLFVFPTARHASFWMKDTQISLSIAFLDDDGRIISIQKMAPLDVEKRYRSGRPVRYALEVNQGWFVQHRIRVGDMVELQLPAMLDIR